MVKGDIYVKLIRFFHGPFITAIIKGIDVEDTEENRNEVKRIIKNGFNIEHMDDLAGIEIGEVIVEVAMKMAIEMGIMLPYPGEPENIEELSMGEFLALKK